MGKIKTIFRVGNPFHELLKISIKEEVAQHLKKRIHLKE